MVKTALILLMIFAVPVPMKNRELQTAPDQPKPSIAQIMMDKGLASINDPLRKNVIADVFSTSEEYDTQGNRKSADTDNYTIVGRPKLDKLNIDELYRAFATRFDFYIDNAYSADTINGTTYAVVKYRPKPGLSYDNVTDSFINRVSGKVYINLDNFVIYKIDGGINYPFSTTWHPGPKLLYFISIGIDVYEFNFSIEYTGFNNMVIEKFLTGAADYKIRNRGLEKHFYTLSNYRMRK